VWDLGLDMSANQLHPGRAPGAGQLSPVYMMCVISKVLIIQVPRPASALQFARGAERRAVDCRRNLMAEPCSTDCPLAPGTLQKCEECESRPATKRQSRAILIEPPGRGAGLPVPWTTDIRGPTPPTRNAIRLMAISRLSLRQPR